MNPWVALIAAGLCEIGWPLGFKVAQTAPAWRVAAISLSVASMALSGWLLFLAAEIHERSRTHNSITVTVSVDNYLSWMDIAVSGLPELPDMPFCDFFIRRQQFIYPGVPPTKSGEE